MRAVAMAPGLLSNRVVIIIIISGLPLEEKTNIQHTDKIHSIFQKEGLISL